MSSICKKCQSVREFLAKQVNYKPVHILKSTLFASIFKVIAAKETNASSGALFPKQKKQRGSFKELKLDL